jgi:hypothetical protein
MELMKKTSKSAIVYLVLKDTKALRRPRSKLHDYFQNILTS